MDSLVWMARDLLTIMAKRYGCCMSTLETPGVGETGVLSIKFSKNEYLVLSELPSSTDELRELTLCTSAFSAILEMRVKAMVEGAR